MRVVVFASFAVLALSACPPTGIVCKAGTDRCGLGCADLQRDKRNCGTCGVACGESQECNGGTCVCQAGTTLCNGQCAVLDYDSLNCGACGRACAAGQVCEAGACQAGCSIGTSLKCGASCIDVSANLNNCGACGAACQSGQSCRAGACTYDVVAACFTSGQVTGFSTAQLLRGPLESLGNGPAALASLDDTLLAVDGLDERLYQGALSAAVGTRVLSQRRQFNRTGSVPNQVVVQAPYVFVINASSGTLQVLKKGTSGGETLDAGLAGGALLSVVAELPFGANTFPEALTKVGSSFWVPLYGGTGAEAAQGQKLARVDISNPEAPSLSSTVDLSRLDLRTFDGGAGLARPWAVTSRGTAVYVALNNLTADYRVAGPGLVAKYETTDAGLSSINLGTSCLNPQWIGVEGNAVVVSCAGDVTYDSSYNAVATRGTGVALVNEADSATTVWTADCALDAGCSPLLPGRFATKSGRIYVADQNFGRVVVLERQDGGVNVATTMNVCPAEQGTGHANVSDVYVVP